MMAALRDRASWYLVALAGLIGLFGIGDVVGGAAIDPGIALGVSGRSPSELAAESPAAHRMFDFTSRTQGWNLVVLGVLLLVVLLVPYRAGQRWAWRLAWALPLWSFGVAGMYLGFGLAAGQPLPPPLISGPILGGLAVAVLLVERGRFESGERPAIGSRSVPPEPAPTGSVGSGR